VAPELAIGGLAGRDLLIGYSGGLDSTVLLHACATRSVELAIRLRAIHVDHGLHPDSQAWSRHCAEFCLALGVDLVVAPVAVRSPGKAGREAVAREARYAAFAAHLLPGECLVLAHHRDDQAETVLLRLLRASGGAGLASMQGSRAFGAQQLLRPLLHVSSELLRQYAGTKGLSWIEDPSNSDESLDRNFLRRRVLPLLRERWPQAEATLARSATLLAEEAQLLDACVVERLRGIASAGARQLDARALLRFDPAWRSRMLRRWVQESGLPPLPGKAIEVIESDLLSSRADARAEIRWRGATMRVWRHQLHLDSDGVQSLPKDWQCRWDGEGTLLLPGGDSLAFLAAGPMGTTTGPSPVAAPFLHGMLVRGRRGGERIALPGRKQSHALKNCLQESSVPPWQRSRLPLLLASDGELLAAGDALVSERLDRFCGEHALRLHYRRACLPRGD